MKTVYVEYALVEKFQNIFVKSIAADVTIQPADGMEPRVACSEGVKRRHGVTVEGDTLKIQLRDNRNWFRRLLFRGKKAKITLFIPRGEYGALKINCTTGDVTIPNCFGFGSADISVVTGDISIAASTAGTIRCKTTTGNTCLTGVRCSGLTAAGTTGDVQMQNVIVAGTITVRRTKGDITMESCDGAELLIRTVTGSLKASLLSPKVFRCKTTTGKVLVPQSAPGGLCDASVTTGNIEITAP